MKMMEKKKKTRIIRQIRVVSDEGVTFNVTLERVSEEEEGCIKFYDATPRKCDVFGGHGVEVAGYFVKTVRGLKGGLRLECGGRVYTFCDDVVDLIKDYLLGEV